MSLLISLFWTLKMITSYISATNSGGFPDLASSSADLYALIVI